jgi:hypothetical protein
MVLAFAWGSLTADQARRTFDLFTTKITPKFMKTPAAAELCLHEATAEVRATRGRNDVNRSRGWHAKT